MHKVALGSLEHMAFILQDLHNPEALKFASVLIPLGHLPESGTSTRWRWRARLSPVSGEVIAEKRPLDSRNIPLVFWTRTLSWRSAFHLDSRKWILYQMNTH
jgi:hypothetical protein